MRLKLNETYIYYDLPIIFSALDEDGNTFICLLAEETDSHLRYICVQISQTTLMELEHNRQDIRSLFTSHRRVFSLLLNAESEEPVEAVETMEDITPFLPEKDLFIGTDWEPIPSQGILSNAVIHINTSFSVNIDGQYTTDHSNNYFEEGDIPCLQVA
jgi:hypothetical protein